jgi:glucose/arabinose dehydrogenase
VKAQDLSTHFGKVVRINPDGSVPQGNPYVGQAGARPEVWSYGHRNIQAAAFNPATRELWAVEHGPQGGDELNIPKAGKNYGWPVITYGEDYGGGPIGQGITAQAGMEQPVYHWPPPSNHWHSIRLVADGMRSHAGAPAVAGCVPHPECDTVVAACLCRNAHCAGN